MDGQTATDRTDGGAEARREGGGHDKNDSTSFARSPRRVASRGRQQATRVRHASLPRRRTERGERVSPGCVKTTSCCRRHPGSEAGFTKPRDMNRTPCACQFPLVTHTDLWCILGSDRGKDCVYLTLLGRRTWTRTRRHHSEQPSQLSLSLSPYLMLHESA